MNEFFHLCDLADVDVLQEIQDSFCEATQLATLVSDRWGKPVTGIGNFTSFCKRMRSNPKGEAMCIQSDFEAGRIARKLGKPFIYLCHAGLVDVAAPIVVENHHLGSMMTGQVVLKSEEETKLLPRIIPPQIEWEKDPKMVEYYDKIKRISMRRLEAAAKSITIMANYVVGKGLASIVQEQLHRKDLHLIEERRMRAELEKTLKDTELKALQSQINPHFLFNTLNIISRLSILEPPEKTQEMVHALARLLRYSLRRTHEVVTLGEELEQVGRYLLIQKVRFGERIQAEIDVPAELLSLKIPLLTLQPLIENSIVHGLEPKKSGGKISIRGQLQGQMILLNVIDDGLGMPAETIDRILTMNDKGPRPSTSRGHTTGLGIANVHLRLLHHFGQEYRLSIDSTVGKGTTISLLLPDRRGEL
jgi:two-component system LytT family sensor kinase